MRAKIVIPTLLIVAAAIGLVWFVLREQPDTPVVENDAVPESTSAAASAVSNEPTRQSGLFDANESILDDTDELFPEPEDDAECWEFAEIGAIGLPQHEVDAVYSVMFLGPDFVDYRHLGPDELEAFAAQGDSAAMLMVGMMKLGYAFGIDHRDISELMMKDLDALKDFSPAYTEMSENQRRTGYVEASKWFYESALRGRLSGLIFYGLVQQELGGTPVGLGWVSAEEYDALERPDRRRLGPESVYQGVIFELAPGLAVGPIASSEMFTEATELDRRVRQRLVERYHQDLLIRGLPRPPILDVQLPALDAAMDDFCDD